MDVNEEKHTLDTSTIVNIAISLFSIAVSIAFAITGFYFSKKSDINLATIKTEIDSLHRQIDTIDNKSMTIIQDERKAHDEKTMQLMVNVMEAYKGYLPKEKAEGLEKQMNEVLRLQQQFDSASVLSKQSKVEGKKSHA